MVYGSGDQEYMPRGQKGKQPPVMAPDTDLKSRSSQRAQVETKVGVLWETVLKDLKICNMTVDCIIHILYVLYSSQSRSGGHVAGSRISTML